MFVAELRKLTEYCEYGESLNDMLRDRLVCGINHERTQQRLLSGDSTLTLEKALDIALSLESAISQGGYMNNKSETQILKVSNKEVKKCYRVTEITQPSHALSSIKSVLLSQQRSYKQSLL